jgi:hypothetical protein
VILFNGCDGRWSPTACSGVLALGGLGWNSGQTKVVNGVTFVRARAGFVSFNPYAACSFGDACNVQEITTHELGHALGLGHSALTDPTMYGFAHFDGRCAGLRQDDRDGMTFIYPSSTQTWVLTVRSANPASGVSITVSPNDVGGMGTGSTQFTRTYNDTTVVTLTAPSTASGHPFVKWLRNGLDDTTNLSTSVTMLSNVIMTAVYKGRPVKFDIDGDVKADLGFYRNGLWGMLKSSQAYSFGAAQFASWGGSGLPPLTADFDGDAKADLVHIVPPAGGQSAAYAVLKSSTNYDFGQAQFFPAGFPSVGDTPVVGDFDGDGKADPGVWRASTAVWIIPLSSMNYSSLLFTQWGANGDVPIVGDFDLDGRDDIGFYRNGLWGVLKSSQSYSFGAAQFFSWGGAGMAPITGDFDGDGKCDIGHVVPPAGGQSAVFAILKSSTNYDFGQGLFVPAGFPVLGDTPTVSDFDGDGKSDPGVWRSSAGIWLIPLSSTNYASVFVTQWGQSGDTSIPNRPNEP